jgi:hypothetical protein
MTFDRHDYYPFYTKFFDKFRKTFISMQYLRYSSHFDENYYTFCSGNKKISGPVPLSHIQSEELIAYKMIPIK